LRSAAKYGRFVIFPLRDERSNQEAPAAVVQAQISRNTVVA